MGALVSAFWITPIMLAWFQVPTMPGNASTPVKGLHINARQPSVHPSHPFHPSAPVPQYVAKLRWNTAIKLGIDQLLFSPVRYPNNGQHRPIPLQSTRQTPHLIPRLPTSPMPQVFTASIVAWRTVLLGKTPLADVPALLVKTIPHVITRSWLFWVPVTCV